MTLEIRVLGNVEFRLNGQPVSGFVSRKAQALFCYLALTPRQYSRDKLADLLWGEMPERKAHINLRKALSNLNKLFPNYLNITRQSVAFKANRPHSIDALQLINQVEALPARAALSAAERAALTAAISNYQGDFMEGFHLKNALAFEEWALVWRERLRNLAMRGLRVLSVDHSLRREYLPAIDYLGKLLTLNPWQEEVHRQLMLLLARSGQRNAALAQYHTCRQILGDELGVEPMAETSALYRRIKSALSLPQHNLPPQPTPFIGRKDDLNALTTLLVQPDCRLVTIVGPGGFGKTRLALQAAAELANDFLNGVRYVSLSNADTVELLISAIAKSLDLSFSDHQTPKTQLLERLRRADKEMLLVLDNFEQLLADPASAGAAQLIGDILSSAANLKLLITSHEALHIRWEQQFRLGGLRIPPANAYDAPETYDAAALFLNRARRVQHRFAPTPAAKRAIAAICRLLNGIPLAIELAAAWTPSYSCPQIAREIEKNLNFLTTSLRDAPERHKSLRATFRYSWNLLGAAEQSVFKKLAVFQGVFSSAAAKTIAQATPDALNTLIKKSLLQLPAPGQYQLHQHLRQYAIEILQQDPAEQAQILCLHSAYFAQFVQRRETALEKGEEQSAIAAALQNIRSGWQWAIANTDIENINAFVGGLFIYYDITGNIQEGESLLAQGAAALQKATLPQAQATLGRLLIRQGWFRFRQGKTEKAEEMLARGLSLLSKTENRRDIGLGLGHLGTVMRAKGDYAYARQLHQQSLKAYCAAENLAGQAAALNNLGVDAQRLGEIEEAQRAYQRSLEIRTKIGDLRGSAAAMGNLGVLAYLEEDYSAARKFFLETLQVHRKTGEKFNIMMTLNNLGGIGIDTQSYQEAKIYIEEALKIAREMDEPVSISTALANLGALAAGQGATEQARRYLSDSLRLALKIHEEALALNILAEIMLLQQTEQPERALQIASFLQHYPVAALQANQKAQKVYAALKSSLLPDVFASNQSKGAAMQLEELTAIIFNSPSPSLLPDQIRRKKLSPDNRPRETD